MADPGLVITELIGRGHLYVETDQVFRLLLQRLKRLELVVCVALTHFFDGDFEKPYEVGDFLSDLVHVHERGLRKRTGSRPSADRAR
jgi:hypothetical protein